MKRRLAALFLACLLLAGCLPAYAFASEGASNENGLTVSYEADAAAKEGCDFALSGFSRAQTGTSAKINEEYYGYHFLAGADGEVLSMVAIEGFVVVYVPEKVAGEQGINLADSKDTDSLKELLLALDDQNANGGATIAPSDEWTFTSKQDLELNGISFGFSKELKPGFFYDTIVGSDGSDVSRKENPAYVNITHACYASIVKAADLAIAKPPSTIERIGSFMSTVNMSPLWVTLKTTLTAIVFVFALGLLAAYWALYRSPRVQDIADSIFTIPMVLPPTVCGFLLLLLLGKSTFIGRWFIDIGFPLIFSWPATVIAAVVVAFPLMYRSARGAFENLDPNMLDAARTLGWSNAKIFFKLMLPLSWSSIAAGTVLAFARALGEFGATLFLAGNYLGITRTIPIAIYFEWMNGNTSIALFWTGVILVFSFAVILFINLWSRRTTRYRKGREAR